MLWIEVGGIVGQARAAHPSRVLATAPRLAGVTARAGGRIGACAEFGHEIVMIDAMVDPDYQRKVLEACDGALCFASSCILGYQVYDGYLVALAVREKFPKLPILWRRPGHPSQHDIDRRRLPMRHALPPQED